MPVAEISKAKFFTTKALEFCTSQAMQILGGAGFLRANPVERIFRKVKVREDHARSVDAVVGLYDLARHL